MHLFEHKDTILEPFLKFEDNNFFFLLVSLLLVIVLWPLLRKFGIGHYFYTTLIFIALFSSTHILIRKKLISFIVGGFFLFLVVALKILETFYHQFNLLTIYASSVIAVLSSFFIMLIILRHIFSTRKVGLNEIYGSICIYILIGIMWGLMYFLAAEIFPNSISPSPNSTDPLAIMPQYVYYSFVTLTSSGTLNVTSFNFLNGLLVIGEVIVGQMYPLILISWLVGHLSNLHKF